MFLNVPEDKDTRCGQSFKTFCNIPRTNTLKWNKAINGSDKDVQELLGPKF
jgi:hypothetical protein